MTIVVNKRTELYGLEEQVKDMNLLNLIPNNLRLLFCSAKVEKSLQEIMDSNYLYDEKYKMSLETPYKDLLLYSLLCLHIEGISLSTLFSSELDEPHHTDIFSLSEYSIKRYEHPLVEVYDKNFKALLFSIIKDISDSAYFDKIKHRYPWK